MGRPIPAQKRGKGSNKYTAPSHRFKCTAKYTNREARGTVTNFVDDPSKTAILAEITWDDGSKINYIAAEGVHIDQQIVQGKGSFESGNIMALADIPEGMPIFNIERVPGDGGKAVRASGNTAYIVGKKETEVTVKLPSKKTQKLNNKCRATLGIVAGGGRTDKPLIKAGANHFKQKARGHRFPVLRGVAMNAVQHPFGGSQHHAGKPTTVKRTAPPGRKVGHIAARRTGRKKRK